MSSPTPGPRPGPGGRAEIDEEAYRQRIAALEDLDDPEQLGQAAERLTALMADLDRELGEQPDR